MSLVQPNSNITQFINNIQDKFKEFNAAISQLSFITFHKDSYIPCHHKLSRITNYGWVDDVFLNNHIEGRIWINPSDYSFCFSLNKKTPLLKSDDFYSGIKDIFKDNFLSIFEENLKQNLFEKLPTPTFKSNNLSEFNPSIQTNNLQLKTQDLALKIFNYLKKNGLFSDARNIVDSDHPFLHSEANEGIEKRYRMQVYIHQQTDLDPQYFGTMFYYIAWESLIDTIDTTILEAKKIIKGMLESTIELDLFDSASPSDIEALVSKI